MFFKRLTFLMASFLVFEGCYTAPPRHQEYFNSVSEVHHARTNISDSWKTPPLAIPISLISGLPQLLSGEIIEGTVLLGLGVSGFLLFANYAAFPSDALLIPSLDRFAGMSIGFFVYAANTLYSAIDGMYSWRKSNERIGDELFALKQNETALREGIRINYSSPLYLDTIQGLAVLTKTASIPRDLVLAFEDTLMHLLLKKGDITVSSLALTDKTLSQVERLFALDMEDITFPRPAPAEYLLGGNLTRRNSVFYYKGFLISTTDATAKWYIELAFPSIDTLEKWTPYISEKIIVDR